MKTFRDFVTETKVYKDSDTIRWSTWDYKIEKVGLEYGELIGIFSTKGNNIERKIYKDNFFTNEFSRELKDNHIFVRTVSIKLGNQGMANIAIMDTKKNEIIPKDDYRTDFVEEFEKGDDIYDLFTVKYNIDYIRVLK